MRTKLRTYVLVVVGLLMAAGGAQAVDREEGGYVGKEGEGHPTVVYNFLKHFDYTIDHQSGRMVLKPK